MKSQVKKFFALSVASLAIVACSKNDNAASNAAAASAATPTPGKQLIVATDTAFVPFEFKQGDKYVGFDIDLWDAIAKDLKLDYKLQPMEFNGILPGLQTKNIDVALAGMTITDERKKAVDFSDGYYDAGLSVLVAQNSTITGVTDLKGKHVAIKTGTAGAEYAKQNLKDSTLHEFPSDSNAYMELTTGRVDAVIHDSPTEMYYANNAGKGKVKVVGTPINAKPYGIAFPKGSPLIADVNKELAKLKSDGTYNKIYKKWFGIEPPTTN